MAHPLDALFAPRSIAVVGVSKDPGKRGHQAVRALIDSGFEGRIVPVHPEGGERLGLPVATSIEAIGDPVDLAFLSTRAEIVVEVLEACAAAGFKAAVIPAVGFGESGAEGERRQRAIRDVADRTGIRILGPNTSGVLNTACGLNLIGLADVPVGDLAVVTQSGNIALATVRQAAQVGRGVSIVAGVGNQVDVGFDEILSYLEDEPATRAIALYVEGFRDGRAFLAAAARVATTKPIVALAAGRTEAGGRTARSHTGALAGDAKVLSAALAQAGVIEVTRSDELLPVGAALAEQPVIEAGTGLAILADGGGQATLAADALTDLGVPLAKLGESTRQRLSELLGPAASVANPVDLAGAADRDPRVFGRAAEILFEDPGVGGLLLVGLFGGYALRFDARLGEAEAEAATALVLAAADRPLVVHTLYADAATGPLERLTAAGVPVIGSIEVAARCAAALAARRPRAWILELPDPAPAPAAIVAARSEGRSALTEAEAREIAAAHGVPLAPAILCVSGEEAATAAEAAAGPVAVRAVSSKVLHKSDAGGVALDVDGPEAARAAFKRVTGAVREYAAARNLDARLTGAFVGPMLPEPLAELLVGVTRDSRFGPTLLIGAGGIRAELAPDTVVRVLPIGDDAIEAMIGELRIAPLFAGWRGAPAIAVPQLITLVRGLADAALAHPEIEALEINPVFAYADEVAAVDVRAVLDRKGDI